MTSPLERFGDWVNEHYEPIYGKHRGPDFRCRRCGKQVNYVTKHARERHGDHIEVMPVKNARIGELVY